MILLWHYYWPTAALALVIGFLTGTIFYRRLAAGRAAGGRRERNLVFAGGAALALLLAGLWHGPIGTGARFADDIESAARTTLTHYEMDAVSARVERSPLRRRLILSGPGDDVQQRELARIMDQVPGVSDVRWANPPGAPVWMK